ncbi:alpha/beta hydrolase [Actinoplanes sp. NPDC051851]|uniref:alpha/beta hydrolase n=1 Tax=Actinoplanes sp. NPDC051851 TaxID=3154753 RepID=UPI003447CAD2
MRKKTLVLAASLLLGGMTVRAATRRLRALRSVAPELRSPLLLVPVHLGGPRTLRLLRRVPAGRTRIAPGVAVAKGTLAARGEHPPVDVYVYQPSRRSKPSGALLWIHGGGFVLGQPVAYHELASRFARELGIVVVSVDYRLAPEHPFPAGLEDCWTALSWLHDHTEELGIDPGRLAVGGDSAGGGLTAALSQMALDRGGPPICFQLMLYPMLDDRTVLRHDHAGTGAVAWSPVSNRYGWTAYLGHTPGPDEPRPYAAPARRDDLSGLPPAWVGVGDIDLFHAEDVAYADRLSEAGVPCELLVVPGMYHGADTLFDGKVPSMTAFRASMIDALRRGLAAAR